MKVSGRNLLNKSLTICYEWLEMEFHLLIKHYCLVIDFHYLIIIDKQPSPCNIHVWWFKERECIKMAYQHVEWRNAADYFVVMMMMMRIGTSFVMNRRFDCMEKSPSSAFKKKRCCTLLHRGGSLITERLVFNINWTFVDYANSGLTQCVSVVTTSCCCVWFTKKGLWFTIIAWMESE